MEQPFKIASSDFNCFQLFQAAAKRYPHKAAIIEEKRSIGFSELEAEVNATAAYFLNRGIRPGDRVLVFVPMSIDLYRIVLALFRIGAVAVFLDAWVGPARMAACCQMARCKAFIGSVKVRALALFYKELRKIPIQLGLSVPKDTQELPPIDTNSKDTALITFTTGSTGPPKAAVRSHGFLQEQFRALCETIGLSPDAVSMPVLPIVLLLNLGLGATSVLAKFKASRPDRMNAEGIAQQITAFGVTQIIASPFFIKQLSRHLLQRHRSLPSLQHLITGGAPVFPAEAALYTHAFPSTNIQIVYGSTEAEPISVITTGELCEENNSLNKGLPVGHIHPEAEVKIITLRNEVIVCDTEQALQHLEMPKEEIGEIIVRGPHVLREYLDNEEALKRNKIFIGTECWHRTGDSGYLDAHGQLYLTGRCNTLLYQEGRMLAPFLYENYFQSLPGVELGTLLQVEGRTLAVLEARPEVRETVRTAIQQLPEKIDAIHFLNKMPRDPRHHSKVDYAMLHKKLKSK